MSETPRSRPFPALPGIECWRYYGVVWPSVCTSNGSPWTVRSHVKHQRPDMLAEFDGWVADMSGWPIEWPTGGDLRSTDWTIRSKT